MKGSCYYVIQITIVKQESLFIIHYQPKSRYELLAPDTIMLLLLLIIIFRGPFFNQHLFLPQILK